MTTIELLAGSKPPCTQTHHQWPQTSLFEMEKAQQKTSADDQMLNSLNWDPAHFYQNDDVMASQLISYNWLKLQTLRYFCHGVN